MQQPGSYANTEAKQMLINNDQLGVTAIPSEIAVDFAIALWRNFSGPAALSVVQIRSNQCAARQSCVDSFVLREVQIVSKGNQGKQITP